MTTIAAPPRRARGPARESGPTRATSTRRSTARSTRSVAPTRAVAAPRAPSTTRTEARPPAVGRMGALLAVVTVIALVTAVLFHVLLAQNQLELDHLNAQIASEQRTYEQRRLTASVLASPQHVIQEAERLGLALPAEPPPYLQVPNAPMPKTDDPTTADTIAEWSKTKPSLGARQP